MEYFEHGPGSRCSLQSALGLFLFNERRHNRQNYVDTIGVLKLSLTTR